LAKPIALFAFLRAISDRQTASRIGGSCVRCLLLLLVCRRIDPVFRENLPVNENGLPTRAA
jgi:hypothetical protein